MSEADCLFCKIADREIPSTVVYESESVLGFNDIRPQAPVHILFMPKRHISGIHEVTARNVGEAGALLLAANEVAREKGLSEAGYRLVVNCKADGGQTVDHLHLHLLGGRRMTWPPG
ncbi:MAG: histidine triad nucleotide-binding protein [Candidatus Omnitrophica bacterium]|nr:histidine triad nucleotide-binding protein [Candidatus Omnitrophota bacterium]